MKSTAINSAKHGFPLLEILVASLLLGMLMTILTMVFNSSAIAWRTGRASNSMMSKTRRQLSYAQYLADNALPRVDPEQKSATGRILGAWDGSNKLRTRSVEIFSSFSFPLPNWDSLESAGQSVPQPWQQVRSIQNLRSNGGQNYVVGVHSYGPDGKVNTVDDIDTMPVLFK